MRLSFSGELSPYTFPSKKFYNVKHRGHCLNDFWSLPTCVRVLEKLKLIAQFLFLGYGLAFFCVGNLSRLVLGANQTIDDGIILFNNFFHSFILQLFQLNWVCDDEWKISLSQSLFFAGATAGTLVFGWISDHSGRFKVSLDLGSRCPAFGLRAN